MNPVAIMNTTNPKTNYCFTEPGATLVRTDPVDTNRLDYTLPRTEEDIKKGHKEDLPISFFQVSNVEEGKEWYMNKFPKLTDEFAHLLARYNWGDLKYATKKSMKNAKKKALKKNGKKDDIVKGIKINKEPIILKFE